MVELRSLSPNGPAVPPLCFGTSPLGGMERVYGYDVSAEQAFAAIRRMLEEPAPFLDTSNEYGNGASEERIGAALAVLDPPSDLVLATKADPLPGSRVFDGARVRESFAESTARLGVETVDVFHLHDPERFPFEYLSGPGGALAAMAELKTQGRARVIGVAGGLLSAMREHIDTGIFDVVLTHNRYNLLDRSAGALIDHARAAGLAVINAAPYASGILARPFDPTARFHYRPAQEAEQACVRRLHALCAEAGVPLAAAALQFSTRDERIASTVVGVSHPDRVEQAVRNLTVEIPSDLWAAIEAELEGAVRTQTP